MEKINKYCLLACNVLNRECLLCASRSPNIVDVRFMNQDLHDMGEEKMVARLQEELNGIDPDAYDAILMGYGLCNNGIRGLTAPLPMVIPRAHDCITLLLGSKEKYLEYFHANPGTYYKSVGWIERVTHHLSNPHSTTTDGDMASYADYIEKYGEENAKYIWETLGDGLQNYSRLAFIDTGTIAMETYRKQEQDFAAEKGWQYEEVPGNTGILQRLVDGEWDAEDFLVVPPGSSVVPSHDDNVIKPGP